MTIEQIGNLIREKRKVLGLTQAKLARLCGVGVRFLSELERGKTSIELGKTLKVIQQLGLDIRILPKSNIPSFLNPYFWDIDVDSLDLVRDSKYIIGKILESGDERTIRWMKQHYTQEEITDVLFHFRFVSPKSANFWMIIYNLPQEKILCLQKPYQKKQRRHWNY